MIAFIRLVSRWFAWGAGALILASAIAIGVDVVMRNAFRLVPMHSFELSRYAFGAAIAFGFAYALVERAHIRIDILHRLTPRGIHGFLDLVALAALVPVTLALAWYAWDVVLQSARLGAVSNTPLAMKLIYPQGLWAIGLTWFAFVAVVLMIAALVALATRRPERLEEIAGMPGLFGEGAEALEVAKEAVGKK